MNHGCRLRRGTVFGPTLRCGALGIVRLSSKVEHNHEDRTVSTCFGTLLHGNHGCAKYVCSKFVIMTPSASEKCHREQPFAICSGKYASRHIGMVDTKHPHAAIICDLTQGCEFRLVVLCFLTFPVCARGSRRPNLMTEHFVL